MAQGTHLDMTEIAAEALLKSYEKMAAQLDFFSEQLTAIERNRDETMKRIESMCWQLLHGQAMTDSPTTSSSGSVPELEEETWNVEIIQEVADVDSSGGSITGSELDMLCSAEREMVEIDSGSITTNCDITISEDDPLIRGPVEKANAHEYTHKFHRDVDSAERDCDLKISSDLNIFLIPTEFRLDGNNMEQNCSLTPLSIEEGEVESDANVRAKSDGAFKEEISSKLGDIDNPMGGVDLDTELHRFGLVNMNYYTDFNELQIYSMIFEEESKKKVAKTCSIIEKDALFSGWTETINFSEFVSVYHKDYATKDCDYQTSFNDDSILISSDISQLDGKRKEVQVTGCSGDNIALFDPGGIVIDLCFSNNENLNCWRKNSITSIDCSMVLPQLDGKFDCKTVYELGLIQTYGLNYTSCISHNFMLELKQFGINDSINCALHKSSYLEQYKGRVTDIERLLVLGQIGFGGSDKMAFQLHASLLSVVCLLNIKLNMDANTIMVYHFGLSDEKWNDDVDKLNSQQYLEAIMTSFLSKDDYRLSCVEMKNIDGMILQIFFEGIIATVATLQEGSRDVTNLLKCLLYPFDPGGCPFHKFTTNVSLTKTNILLSGLKWNSLDHLSTLHPLPNEAQLTLSSIKLIWELYFLTNINLEDKVVLNRWVLIRMAWRHLWRGDI